MSWLAGIALFTATVLVMEGFAYVLHRFVMHSKLGLGLAREPSPRARGLVRANDLYAVVFALPSMLLIWGGLNGGWGDWATWVGAGVAFLRRSSTSAFTT
jgi:beta-carotene 3-hydroxylase